MTNSGLIALIDRLRALPTETEWSTTCCKNSAAQVASPTKVLGRIPSGFQWRHPMIEQRNLSWKRTKTSEK